MRIIALEVSQVKKNCGPDLTLSYPRSATYNGMASCQAVQNRNQAPGIFTDWYREVYFPTCTATVGCPDRNGRPNPRRQFGKFGCLFDQLSVFGSSIPVHRPVKLLPARVHSKELEKLLKCVFADPYLFSVRSFCKYAVYSPVNHFIKVGPDSAVRNKKRRPKFPVNLHTCGLIGVVAPNQVK